MKLQYKQVIVEEIDHLSTGEMARELRVKLDVSISSMAARIGVTTAHVSLLERGARRWSKQMVEQYSAALTFFKEQKNVGAKKRRR